MEVAPEPAPVASKPEPRPDRPPPPPQPQDGSMIVKPGGTGQVEVPKLSDGERDDAISSAEAEIKKRKADAGEGDDIISKALQDVDQEDIDAAFSKLREATKELPEQ